MNSNHEIHLRLAAAANRGDVANVVYYLAEIKARNLTLAVSVTPAKRPIIHFAQTAVIARLLTEAGAHPLAVDENGNHALIHRAQTGQKFDGHLVDFFALYGLDLTVRNSDGYSALYLCAEKGWGRAVRSFIRHGITLSRFEMTTLFMHVQCNRKRLELIGNGIKPSKRELFDAGIDIPTQQLLLSE